MSIVEILILVVMVGYAVYRQTQRHEVVGSSRFKLAIIYAVVGLVVGGFSRPDSAAEWGLLAASVALSVVVGVARGRLTRVWADETAGERRVFSQGTAVTVALFAPGTALLALVFVFGAYAILDGVTALAVGIRHRKDDPHWVWHVVQGVVSVLAGVIAFAWPGVTVLAILFVIAFWSIVGGIAEVVESFMMRKRGSEGWGWMLAAGIVSVLFGIVLLASPNAALITLLWLVGVYAIVFGVIIVVWAVRLRRAVSAATTG